MVTGPAPEPLTQTDRADLLFHALADATRRDIITVALRTEQSVSALARRYPMSFAAVQKHVAVLERAGLVTKQRRGREQVVRGNATAITDVHRLLDQLETVWRDRLDRFGDILRDDIHHHGASNEMPHPAKGEQT